MTLTNEQCRKLAELAGWPVSEWFRGAPADAVVINAVPSTMRPNPPYRVDGTVWRPEADLNQLAELLEAVGRKRGWTRTEIIWYSDYPNAPEAVSFSAYIDGFTYLDCDGAGATETEAKLNALLGIE
jgi:hypothetical protein